MAFLCFLASYANVLPHWLVLPYIARPFCCIHRTQRWRSVLSYNPGWKQTIFKGDFCKKAKNIFFFFFFSPILYAVSILVTAAVYSNRKFGFLCWSWITQMIVLFLFDLLFCFYLTFLLSSPDHFTFHPSVTLSSYQFKLQTTNAITGKIFHFIPEWVRQGTIIEQTWPIKFPQGTKFNNFVRNRLHEDPSITIRVDPKSMVTVAQAY